MYIVVIGMGKVGTALTESLSGEGHDIVVIDNKSDVIENAVNKSDVMALLGNGATYRVQKEAGVEKAELLIAVTRSDELNILCCMIGRKIGAKNTIARVRNPEYSSQLLFMRNELGLSMMINPEYEAASEISRILRFPSCKPNSTISQRGGSTLWSLSFRRTVCWVVSRLICSTKRQRQRCSSALCSAIKKS